MKKITTFILAILFLTSLAMAEDIKRADTALDERELSRYLSYSEDENGCFSVKNAKAAAIEQLFYDKLGTLGAKGLLAFYTEVNGSANTRISYPVLKVLYAGNDDIQADYISFAFDGVRYDLCCSHESEKIGKVIVQKHTVYLDQAGFDFISKLENAKSVDVALLGSGQYIQEVDKKDAYGTNVKQELAGESLKALGMVTGAPDYAAYDFAEDAKAVFEAKYGKKYLVNTSELTTESVIKLDAEFGLVVKESNTASIRAFQKLLKSAGFYQGAEDGKITQILLEGVKSAQAYYGLPQTGYADALLIEYLNGKEYQMARESYASKPQYDFVTAQAQFALNRWWLADEVQTTVPGNGVKVVNKDNVLVVADGDILSINSSATSLSWEISAKLVINESYTFPAVLYVEAQNGEVFQPTLDIYQQSRLVFVSEVPDYMLNSNNVLKIRISSGDEEFVMKLVR